jgi:hypothetical protein
MKQSNLIAIAGLVFPIISLFTSCGSVTSISDAVEVGLTRVVSNPESYRLDNEKVKVKIETNGGGSGGNVAAFDAGVTAFVASYVAGEVIKGAEEATKNFSISYTGSELGYPLKRFSGFTVTRTVEKNDDLASELVFSVKEYQNTGYYFIEAQSADVAKSKSATPWWKNTVDVVVDIDISTPGAGKNGGTVVIDADQIVLKGIKVGGEPIYDFKGTTKTGLFQLPEKSTPFFLKVSVQEMSDFTKVAEKGNKLIGEKKEGWQKKLEGALGGE